MRIDILTLFPDAVEASLKISILGRAEKKGILDIHAVQIRDYTEPRRRAFWTSTPSRSATIPKTNSSRWTITPTAAAGAA